MRKMKPVHICPEPDHSNCIGTLVLVATILAVGIFLSIIIPWQSHVDRFYVKQDSTPTDNTYTVFLETDGRDIQISQTLKGMEGGRFTANELSDKLNDAMQRRIVNSTSWNWPCASTSGQILQCSAAPEQATIAIGDYWNKKKE